MRAEPVITLQELSCALIDTHSVSVQLSFIHRALQRAGFSSKKGLIAQERDRPALRLARRLWPGAGLCPPLAKAAPGTAQVGLY